MIWRRAVTMWAIAASFALVGCGAGHGDVREDTDTRKAESVFDPMVSALDRAQGLEAVAADHNRMLDDALHEPTADEGERR
jgi:hypothetical protein